MKGETKRKPRPCDCAAFGSHRASCKLATTPTPVTCECGRPFPSATARNGHYRSCPSWNAAKGRAFVEKLAEKVAIVARPAEIRPHPPEPPSLRCLVVRVRGAVPLEVECATPEDAAAFVRLVSAGGVS